MCTKYGSPCIFLKKCPWINNCIGFYNRKFFILMLFYSICISLFLIFSTFIGGFSIYKHFNIKTEVKYFELSLVGIGFIANIIYLGVISAFFKFHLELLFNNTTTIESLDRKRNPNNQ